MVLRRIRLVILLLDHIKVCTSNPLHDVIVHTLNSSWQQQGMLEFMLIVETSREDYVEAKMTMPFVPIPNIIDLKCIHCRRLNR